jgi:hypothetical protein
MSLRSAIFIMFYIKSRIMTIIYLTRINRNQTGKINHENTKKDALNFVLPNFRVFVMKTSFAIKCKKITNKTLINHSTSKLFNKV